MNYRDPFSHCKTVDGVYRALTRALSNVPGNAPYAYGTDGYWLQIAAYQRINAIEDVQRIVK